MDQYFTKTETLLEIKEIIQQHQFFNDIDLLVDFSAGDDRFCSLFDIKSESYDISPIHTDKTKKNIIKKDWFTIKKLQSTHRNLAIGLNPPFGYKCQMAKKFVEHAITFDPKIIILIVPRSFTFENPQYEIVMERNLSEDIFYNPNTGKTFCFPTKFVVFTKCLKRKYTTQSKDSIIKTIRSFKIRVAGYVEKETQLLVRRAGVYANEQFYCICWANGKRIVHFMDRGTWFANTDWKDKNHSVEEGGDVSKFHASSNPKKGLNTGKNNVSKTGWSWYKIDFDKNFEMKDLKKLAQFIWKNPPQSKQDRSKDISVLAKSSPPNINTKHLYPLIDSFFK